MRQDRRREQGRGRGRGRGREGKGERKVQVYGMRQRNLPCTVRSTPDRLRKMEVKRLLNGI